MATREQENRMPTDLGERVIDVHHHWLPSELVERLERYLPPGYRAERRAKGVVGIFDPAGLEGLTIDPERWCRPEVQLADMDAAGVDVALLSAACYPAWVTLPAARLLNDASADLQRRYPRRFVAMAHVPPFGEEGALEELERAARELGLRAVCVTTNFSGRYPDDEEFRPFLRKAVELNLTVFVHAAGAPVENRALRPYNLYRNLGRSFDSCLVAARLLASGVLDELPGLRVVIPHLGGGFFLHLDRVLAGPMAAGGEGRGRSRRGLEQLLFDTAPSFVWSPLEIGWAAGRLGVDRLALGSDYPVGPASVLADAVAHVRALPLEATDRARIAGANAAEFFGLAAN
jgi:predicted TIM-barrel fold metal-dependent hydrolase